MWLRLELITKIFSQICLFVFFRWRFGVPNIKRYQNDEVMVVASTKHLGGILAPTISFVARNPVSRTGWKSSSLPWRLLHVLVGWDPLYKLFKRGR